MAGVAIPATIRIYGKFTLIDDVLEEFWTRITMVKALRSYQPSNRQSTGIAGNQLLDVSVMTAQKEQSHSPVGLEGSARTGVPAPLESLSFMTRWSKSHY